MGAGTHAVPVQRLAVKHPIALGSGIRTKRLTACAAVLAPPLAVGAGAVTTATTATGDVVLAVVGFTDGTTALLVRTGGAVLAAPVTEGA